MTETLVDPLLIKKQIEVNRRKFIADIILIVILTAIFVYLFKEIESFKVLSKDVCALCVKKTGAVCYVP